MRYLILFLALTGASLTDGNNSKPITKSKTIVATCTGADPCKACKNCKYCKRCAKNGKKCGICK